MDSKAENKTENKGAAQNIQDLYLNTVRRDKMLVTVFLISGVKLIGKIKAFDKYSVVLESNNQEQLIFKHAISTVTMARGMPGNPSGTSSTAAGASH
jgi:host factor-I protein